MINRLARLFLSSMPLLPGAMAGMAEAEALPDLTAQAWLVVALRGETPLGAMPPTLRFDAEGRVSGSTGCNRFTARYVRDGQMLAISEPATTRMSCPRALLAQETRFLTGLSAVTLFRAGAGAMVILGDEGGEIFRLVPMR